MGLREREREPVRARARVRGWVGGCMVVRKRQLSHWDVEKDRVNEHNPEKVKRHNGP